MRGRCGHAVPKHLPLMAPDPLEVQLTPVAARRLPLTAPDPLAVVWNLLPRTGRCGRRHGGGGSGPVRGRFRIASQLGSTSKSSSPCRQPIPLAAAAARANFARRPPARPRIGRAPPRGGRPARPIGRFCCGIRGAEGCVGGGPHAAPPAPAAPRGAAPPLPPGSRVGHCHTTFQLRTPRCSPPPPPIGSPGPD